MPILSYIDDTPPVTAAQQWFGMGVTWTDCNGKVWDLNGRDVLLVQGEVRGMGMPTFDRYSQTSPALAGSTWKGYRAQERECFWPLMVHTYAGTIEWLGLDRSFWAGLRPDATGTWTITAPDGAARSLDLRFVDDDDAPLTADPMLRGWFVYGISLVAERPYWRGPTINRSWSVTAGGNWLSPATGVVRIAPGADVQTAVATNPGDVEAWPIWRATGPMTSAVLGIGGGSVAYPEEIPDGVTITIDTHPDRMTAVSSTGADLSGDVVWSPLPVPPGASVTASIALVDADPGAIVQMDLDPLYFRAW
jgi:hypothetical protein